MPEPAPKPETALALAADEKHLPARTSAFVVVFIFLLLVAYAADHVPRVWEGGSALRELCGLDARREIQTRWWTPLTYLFFHFDPVHLALNVGALALFGHALSETWPWRRLAVLTLVAGAGGAGLWLAVHHGQRSTVIGASAVVSGYLAAFAIDRPKAAIPLLGTRWSFPRWLLLAVLVGFEGQGLLVEAKRQNTPRAVSHSAHIGGAAAAAAFCLIRRFAKR